MPTSKTEFHLFTKYELAVNVYNQFLDKVVRLEIDLIYHEMRAQTAPHETQEKKQWTKQVQVTKQSLKEGKQRLAQCREYLKGLNQNE